MNLNGSVAGEIDVTMKSKRLRFLQVCTALSTFAALACAWIDLRLGYFGFPWYAVPYLLYSFLLLVVPVLWRSYWVPRWRLLSYLYVGQVPFWIVGIILIPSGNHEGGMGWVTYLGVPVVVSSLVALRTKNGGPALGPGQTAA